MADTCEKEGDRSQSDQSKDKEDKVQGSCDATADPTRDASDDNDHQSFADDPVHCCTETDSNSAESNEDPKHAYHWSSLSKTATPRQSASSTHSTPHSTPSTKELKVQLQKLEAGSPPLTQNVYNSSGQLIGTRVFSKYTDSTYKKTTEIIVPPQFSALSPLISPFSNERKHSSRSPNRLSASKEVTSPSECSSTECGAEDLFLHMDSSQATDCSENPDIQAESKLKPNVSAETRETVLSTPCVTKKIQISGTPTESIPLQGIVNTPPVHPTSKVVAEESLDDPKHSSQKTCVDLKQQVRHLDIIGDVLKCNEEMSNSQLISIMDKLNLKADGRHIAPTYDDFFIGVIKQMQIGGIGERIKGVGHFRRMLAQHLVYEAAYYKLVGDSFLAESRQTFDDYCCAVQCGGKATCALDILAVARFIECKLHLIGCNEEWCSESLLESFEHNDVIVTIILSSPGIFTSTKKNLGRLSLRRRMSELLMTSQSPGPSRDIGRVTIDLLTAPTVPCPQSNTPSSPILVQDSEENSPSASTDSSRKTPTQHKTLSTEPVDKQKSCDTVQPPSDLSSEKLSTKRKKGRPASASVDGKKRKSKSNRHSLDSQNPHVVASVEKDESIAPATKDITSSVKRKSTKPCGDTPPKKKKEVSTHKHPGSTPARNTRQALKDNIARRTRTQCSASSGKDNTNKLSKPSGETASFSGSEKSPSHSASDTRGKKRSGHISPHMKSSSPSRKRSRPSSSVQRSVSSSSSTTSSDETDFSALRTDKLSSADTKYFLNKTIFYIGKLKHKLKESRRKSNLEDTNNTTGDNRPSTSSTSSTRDTSRSRPATSTRSSDGRSKCGWHPCAECPRAFSTPQALEHHQKTHKKKRYACQACDKKFMHYSSLCNHRLEHKNSPFECSKCNRKFSRKDLLKIHTLTHDGEFKFLCNICGKGFTSKGHYDGHMLHHAKKKTHHCSYCNNAFYYRSDMLRHERETCSSQKKPRVPCDICGNTFKTVKYMKIHRNRHDGCETFKCDKCGKIFISTYGFKQHVRQCTGTNKENN